MCVVGIFPLPSRLLEICAMFAVCGRMLDWDVEVASELFEDDGLIIAGFLTSTLAMFLLAIVIRTQGPGSGGPHLLGLLGVCFTTHRHTKLVV